MTMKFNEVMPKTSNLWGKINKEVDNYPHVVKLGELKKELAVVNEQMNKVQDVQEFRMLTQRQGELQIEIKELDILISTKDFRLKRVLREDVFRLPTLYNEEFKPFRKEYIELNKRVKEESKRFADSVLLLLEKMQEIERLETKLQEIKTFGNREINPIEEYIKLPVEEKGFDQQPINFHMKGVLNKEHSSTNKLLRLAGHLSNWK